MTTTSTTRRTALAGTITLPLLPGAGEAAASANATDAASAAAETARADVEAISEEARVDPALEADDGPLWAAVERKCEAEHAVLRIDATTLIDVERKLGILAGIAEGSDIEAHDIKRLHADVCRVLGRPAA